MDSISPALQQKLASARKEARYLYNEVENVRRQTRDQTLSGAAQKLPEIATHSVNPKLYNKLEGHQNKIAHVEWSSDSNAIVSACQDGFMLVWDAMSGYKKKVIQLENPWVLSCAWSSNGKLLASGGLDNNLTVYRIEPDTILRQPDHFYQSIQHSFRGHTAYISGCKFLDGSHIITSSGDMKCKMWDLSKNCCAADYIDHTGDVLALDNFPDDPNLFISGGSDGYCKLWDARTGSCQQNLFVSNHDVNAVRIFPGGNGFIAGSEDGVVRYFDLRADCELNTYSVVNEYMKSTATSGLLAKRDSVASLNSIDAISILSVDFSHSGRLIYVCYSDLGCLIWDCLKAKIVGSIGGHLNKINQVSISGDGLGICTASWDWTMKVWAV